VAEVRRLILAMTGPEEERELRLGWSLWRRAHQAVARRCHAARRSLLSPRPPAFAKLTPATTPAPITAGTQPLTDEKWERVRPLLPPQKPRVGRPRRDQRVVVDAILWVLNTGSSWRDVPRENFGAWETVYGRYIEWRKDGRWERVLEALGDDGISTSKAQVSL
jgi:transposase